MTYHDTAAWTDHALGLDGDEMFRLLVPLRHLVLLLHLLKLLEL